MVHDMYLVQVKAPTESKYPWDYYRVLDTIPGEQAFQPLSRSTCALVNRPGDAAASRSGQTGKP